MPTMQFPTNIRHSVPNGKSLEICHSKKMSGIRSRNYTKKQLSIGSAKMMFLTKAFVHLQRSPSQATIYDAALDSLKQILESKKARLEKMEKTNELMQQIDALLSA